MYMINVSKKYNSRCIKTACEILTNLLIASTIWKIVLSETKFAGTNINFGRPMKATIALHLSINGFFANEWIIGVKEGIFLKMVKLRVTGANTFVWIGSKVTRNFDSSCLTNFVESCFVGGDRTEDTYEIQLVAKGECMIQYSKLKEQIRGLYDKDMTNFYSFSYKYSNEF